MKSFILYLWQLPQNLAGLAVSAATRSYTLYAFFNHRKYYMHRKGTWGVSLGQYIIVPQGATARVLMHESGHCVQSERLGPLYLIVIGVPSALGNLWDRCAHRSWGCAERRKWYYSLPWEHWADVLGDAGSVYSDI